MYKNERVPLVIVPTVKTIMEEVESILHVLSR